MRELRHDFRRIYHTCYDDVSIDEALDLVYTLPGGSLFRAASDPHYAWSDEQYMMAEICDRLGVAILQRAGQSPRDTQIWRMPRPGDAEDEKRAKQQREEAKKKAKEVRKKIEQTDWEEV